MWVMRCGVSPPGRTDRMTIRFCSSFHPRREPRIKLVEVCCHMRGPSSRVLSCGIGPTDLGLEVRCGYDDDLIRSEYSVEISDAGSAPSSGARRCSPKGGFTEVPAS